MADKIIIEVGLDNNDYAKKAVEVGKSIEELKVKQQALKKSGQESTLEFQQNAQQLRSLQAELKANTVLSNNFGDSILGQRAKLALLNQEWAKLSEEQRENSEEGKALSAQMLATTNKLKEQEKGVGDTRRNVGNYSESMKEAISSQLPFFQTITDGVDQFKNLGGSVDGATTATAGFGSALRATGIMIIIQLVIGLINYLKTFAPLVDWIQQKLANLGARFDFISRTIVSFVTNIKSLGDLMSKLGDFIKNPVGAMKEFTAEMEKAGKAAEVLKKAQQDLEDSMTAQEVATAKAQQRISELMLQARNRALDPKARKKLLDEAARLDKEDFDRRNALSQQELANAIEASRIKGGLNKQEIEGLKQRGVEYALELQDEGKLTDENIEQIKTAELNRISILKESTDRQEKIQNKQDDIAEKAAAKAEAAAKKRKEAAEKEAEANQERLDSLARTNALILTERQRELDAINNEIDQKVAKYKKYGQATEQLENERIARIKALRDQFLKDDLAAIEENNQQILDLSVAGIKDQGQRELAQVELNNQRRLAGQDKVIQDLKDRIAKGEQGLTDVLSSEEQLRVAILEDNARIRNEKLDQINEEDIRRAQEREMALAQAKVDNATTPADRLMALQAQLDLEYEIEVQNALKRGEDTFAIHEQFAAKQQALDDGLNKAAIDGINEFGDAFQSVVGKNTVAAKMAADVQAKINAAVALQNNILIIQENMKALSAQGKLPFPANIVAIASTLAALAGAYANAKALVSVPKYQDGGIFESDGKGALLPGYSRTDNTNAKLRSGEAVIVAEATRDPRTLATLSAINVAYGGRPLAGPGSNGYTSIAYPHFATGGIYSSITGSSVTSQMDAQALVEAFAQAASQITVVTDVRDVISAADRRNNAINSGTV